MRETENILLYKVFLKRLTVTDVTGEFCTTDISSNGYLKAQGQQEVVLGQ